MTKHQLRLLLCAGLTLALMVISMFGTTWFRVRIEGMEAFGASGFSIGLRTATVCMPGGVCASFPLSQLPGFYSTISVATFYGSCVLVLIVAYQAGRRLVGGEASEGVSQLGYAFAIGCFCAAGATGYLFAPETPEGGFGPMAMVSVTVTRTWGPAMLLLGDLLALVVLYLAIAPEQRDDVAPLVITHSPRSPALAGSPGSLIGRRLPVTPVRTRPPTEQPATAPAKPDSVSLEPDSDEPRARAPSNAPALSRTTSSIPFVGAEQLASLVGGRSTTSSEDDFALPPPRHHTASAPFLSELDLPPALDPGPAGSTPAVPFALRKKLSYAAETVALSATGVDATREDGTTQTVPWSDVVGVVARRLPAEAPYDGATFIDLVSTAGATLRILPWTKLTGETIHGDDGNSAVERARGLVQFVASRCPEAKLDGATRTFLGSRGQAAQLPNPGMLAQHDERLA